jgi:hypothetical protein
MLTLAPCSQVDLLRLMLSVVIMVSGYVLVEQQGTLPPISLISDGKRV